jgi:hypothetical protein
MNEKALSSHSIEENITYISAESDEYVLKTPDWDYKPVKAEPYILGTYVIEQMFHCQIYQTSQLPVSFI